MPNLKFLIYEPSASGHHLALHVRHIVREALARQWNPALLTAEASQAHPSFALIQKEFGKALPVFFMKHVEFPSHSVSRLKLFRYQLGQYREFSKAFQNLADRFRPEAVYAVNLDYIDKSMALFGSPFRNVPLVGLLMNVGFHHKRIGVIGAPRRDDWLNEKLFFRLLRTRGLRSLLTIDETLYKYCQQIGFGDVRKIHYIPDPAALRGHYSREEARQSLNIADQKIVVLVYGTLVARKGIRELLNAVVDPACPQHVTVLLAGLQNDEIRGLHSDPAWQKLQLQGRLIEQDGFLDDYREYRAFKAADIVWLGYRRFYGSSGVLGQAGLMGLPVIGCREGVIGWMVEHNGLGEVVDSEDRASVVSALRRLSLDPQIRTSFGLRGAELSRQHEAVVFGGKVCDIIKQAAEI